MSNKIDKAILEQSTQEAAEKMAEKTERKDAQDFIDQTKKELKERNPRATNDLIDLVNLIVVTYQEKTILMGGMKDFANAFIEKAAEGNGTRYIKHYLTKNKDFDPNKFIPDRLDPTFFSVEFIKFKNDNGNLATGSEQKMWSFTFREKDLITYFLTGQLNKFIAEQILAKIGDSVIVYIYDKVLKAITNTAGKGKTLNGNAANLFDCLTMELLPEIEQMKLNSADYNVDPTLTEAIDASHTADLIMLVSPKVNTMLNSHIMSQLFNSQKIELTNYVGTIHVPNRQFNFAGDTVTTQAANYIGDDKIIIIDKRNYFKLVNFLEVGGSQEFVNNITRLNVFHLWLAQGYLPWGKVLTYNNANLTVSPSNP